MKYIKYIISILVFVSLCSCGNHFRTEGNYIFPNTLEKMKIGLTKKEVENMIGFPTFYGSFSENTWYYIYENSNKPLRLMNKTIIDSKIIILAFNDNILYKITVLDQSNRNNSIPINTKRTLDSVKKTKYHHSDLKQINIFN